jgi:PKD repeat protein
MERIATILLLAAAAAGLGYGYMDAVERQAAQDAADAVAAELAEAQSAADAVEAAKAKFVIPHDNDANTTAIVVALDGSGSSDADGDAITYTWSLLSGDAELSSDSTNITRFNAEPGEYTIQLTVTDVYGSSTSEEKTVAVSTEPNSAPEAVLDVYQEN